MHIVLSPEVISILRPVSTGMIAMAVIMLLVGRYIMRPRRFKEEIITPATERHEARVLKWKVHAGHTIEQSLYNLAGILTVIGGIIFLTLKVTS